MNAAQRKGQATQDSAGCRKRGQSVLKPINAPPCEKDRANQQRKRPSQLRGEVAKLTAILDLCCQKGRVEVKPLEWILKRACIH